jgi:hypothetical protein
LNYHLKGARWTVVSRRQELILTDEANCNCNCSGLCDALMKNSNTSEVQSVYIILFYK